MGEKKDGMGIQDKVYIYDIGITRQVQVRLNSFQIHPIKRSNTCV